MTTATLTRPTAADYARVFTEERRNVYPAIDAFEARMGYAIDRMKLEAAASVLACPVKKNPPSWQHGRVLYAAARKYFETCIGRMNVLDIGTAKGFSALCLQWAIEDAERFGQVTSIDVIYPESTEHRNTTAELEGPVTLRDILQPWSSAQIIDFRHSTGVAWLERRRGERCHVAFVDGKHRESIVLREGGLLAEGQQIGDIAIFDDLQLIAPAIDALERAGLYSFERLEAKPGRAYAIGVRR